MREQVHAGSCFARAGLLGNPSDGYGGRVIAVTLPQFVATARVTTAQAWELGESELVGATVEALGERWPALVERPGAITFDTSIPRQVGLSGSSAIIIATMRALAARAGHKWRPVHLAKAALEVETEVLGWTAGPQDRVVQAMEGLLDMDFRQAWKADSYERVDQRQLPPMFVAWDRSGGQPSNTVHSEVRERWLAGDSEVVAAMDQFAQLAAQGRAAMDSGSAASQWPDLLRESFKLRCQHWEIAQRDLELVDIGELLGAGVSFAGSGGAVVGAVRLAQDLDSIRDSYQSHGAGFAVLGI